MKIRLLSGTQKTVEVFVREYTLAQSYKFKIINL